jgi:hypothetical protein
MPKSGVLLFLAGLCAVLGLLALPGGGPTPTPPTSGFPPPADQARRLLGTLTVARNRDWAAYRRDAFAIGDIGCPGRRRVLIRDLVSVRLGAGCAVAAGTLADPYTGAILTRLPDIEIDHVVALSAAWRSGAAGWDPARRARFAADPDNLLAVARSANQDKGGKTPDQWRPRRAEWCDYARRWIAVKARYALRVTRGESRALREMLTAC